MCLWLYTYGIIYFSRYFHLGASVASFTADLIDKTELLWKIFLILKSHWIILVNNSLQSSDLLNSKSFKSTGQSGHPLFIQVNSPHHYHYSLNSAYVFLSWTIVSSVNAFEIYHKFKMQNLRLSKIIMVYRMQFFCPGHRHLYHSCQ